MIDVVWQSLYAITALSFVLIAWLFFKAKNGKMRKIFIAFFLSLVWGSVVRMMVGLNVIEFNGYAPIIVIVPIFGTTVWLARYLFNTYRR